MQVFRALGSGELLHNDYLKSCDIATQAHHTVYIIIPMHHYKMIIVFVSTCYTGVRPLFETIQYKYVHVVL